MSGYLLSPEAEDDVFAIWSYLATEASVELANQIESKLFDDFALLAIRPGLGHRRHDLTNVPVLFYRAFPYPYLIIYRSRNPLEIVSVLHAKRNLKRILKQRTQE